MHFDPKTNDLILSQTPGDSVVYTMNYLPAKHVKIAYWNLIDGKSWETCSPLYPITRETAAFILANYQPDSQCIRKVTKEIFKKYGNPT